jgi:nicotinamide riboside kinase
MTLKVLVTGAYSTGKSTIVRRVAQHLKIAGLKVMVLDDVARSSPYPLNKDQDDDGTIWLATTQISRELHSMQTTNDIVICDRGVPDILAHNLDADARKDGILSTILPFLNRWTTTYNIIFLSDVNKAIAIAPDGLRVLDEEYRNRMGIHAHLALEGRSDIIVLPHDEGERLKGITSEVIRAANLSQVISNDRK